MRRTNEQKAETRQHIVDAAGRLFRRHGIDAVGVDAVMHAAGLTHGGFYGHFPSKEALAAEVAAAALANAAARWEQVRRDNGPEEGLRQIVGAYLAPAHVADPERGCVLATLGPELARRPEALADVADSVRAMAETLRRCLPGADTAEALGTLATMVGAVTLARMADTPDMAEAILQAARRRILARHG